MSWGSSTTTRRATARRESPSKRGRSWSGVGKSPDHAGENAKADPQFDPSSAVVLGFLVLSDCPVHLFPVALVVSPGRVQVGLGQVRMAPQDFGIRQPEL